MYIHLAVSLHWVNHEELDEYMKKDVVDDLEI